MIFDVTTLFSDKQTVSNNAVSTNVVDLGQPVRGLQRDIGKGTGIPILIQVVDDFGGAGNVTVFCDVSDAPNFPSGSQTVTAWGSAPVAAAVMKAGYVFSVENVQRHTAKRYMRLRYVVGGTITAGKITAGITMGNQSNG